MREGSAHMQGARRRRGRVRHPLLPHRSLRLGRLLLHGAEGGGAGRDGESAQASAAAACAPLLHARASPPRRRPSSVHTRVGWRKRVVRTSARAHTGHENTATTRRCRPRPAHPRRTAALARGLVTLGSFASPTSSSSSRAAAKPAVALTAAAREGRPDILATLRWTVGAAAMRAGEGRRSGEAAARQWMMRRRSQPPSSPSRSAQSCQGLALLRSTHVVKELGLDFGGGWPPDAQSGRWEQLGGGFS